MLTKTEKFFLIIVLITLAIAIPEYLYMNEHNGSFSGKLRGIYYSSGYTFEYVDALEKQSRDEINNSVFSPLIQLTVVGVTLGLVAIWASILAMKRDENSQENVKFAKFGTIFLSWLIVFEAVVFLLKVLR